MSGTGRRASSLSLSPPLFLLWSLSDSFPRSSLVPLFFGLVCGGACIFLVFFLFPPFCFGRLRVMDTHRPLPPI